MNFEDTPAGRFPILSEKPNTSLYLIIPGEPISKGRPQFNRATGSAYTPTATRTAEKAIAKLYVAENNDSKLDGAISVEITCYVSNRRRRDVDNMGKLILDALNGLAFADDSQVHDLIIRKRYTTKERARSEVAIHKLNENEMEQDHYVEQEVSEVNTHWTTIEEASRQELPAGS
jgi:Holliday junction resolvase RusA-like endonuclease